MTKVNRNAPRPSVTMPAVEGKRQKGESKDAGKKRESSAAQAELDKKTGRTSSFDAMRAVGAPSQGGKCHRTNGNSDSRGRWNGKGTADDSIGRLNGKGNPDDSIGRLNGKGNPDDSIGRLNGKGNADDSIGRFLGIGQNGRSMSSYAGLLKGQSAFGGVQRQQPITYVKGQPVYARTTSQGRAPITYVKGQPVYGSPYGLTSRGLSSVSSKDMRRAVNGLNSDARVTAQSLARQDAASAKVLASGKFQAMPASERESIINLMSKGGSTAATSMSRLFKEGREGVLGEKDRNGATVLQHLTAMSNSKHRSLAADVLSNIASPRGIQQGMAPTCTAATMQYELAKERPTEYARIMRGLAENGRVAMPGGGMLEVDVKRAMSASDAKHDYRTDAEAVFQSAVMDYANGRDRYDLDAQRSVGANGTYRGLFPQQIRDVTGQLFGTRYETRMILNDDDARSELTQLASRERPNRPVLFDISMGSYNHNVSLESVNDKNVTYRDPTTGDVKAMAIKDFIQRLTSVHYAVE